MEKKEAMQMFRGRYVSNGGYVLITMLTQRKDLPEKYPKGPNITLCGVDPIEDGLGSHPLQRKTCLWQVKNQNFYTAQAFQVCD